MDLVQKLEDSQVVFEETLKQKGISVLPIMDLACCIDVSGSFDDELVDGTVNTLLQRLIPWAMAFDPDQKVDVFTFSCDDCAFYVGPVKPSNCGDFIQDEVVNKVPGYGGGTYYANVLKLVLGFFGWMKSSIKRTGKSFFGEISLFLKKKEQANQGTKSTDLDPSERRRVLIIVITDGDNSDKIQTRDVLNNSRKQNDGVFFLFLGVSNQDMGFHFVQTMSDLFTNVGFFEIRDVKRWVLLPDDEINQQLLNDKLIAWFKKTD